MYTHCSWRYQAAIAALARGELIAYPTEAVWGIGCDPFNPGAVEKLLSLKQRPIDKGLILVAADVSQLGELANGLSQRQRDAICAARAKSTTWLIHNDGSVPAWIAGSHTSAAVRISNNPIVKALCEGFGGMLVSSSANRAGYMPALSELKARAYFGAQIAEYVAGNTGGELRPSQIIDLESGQRLR